MTGRAVSVFAFDDGVDRWRFTRAAAGAALAGAVHRYTAYSETTQRFTTRRELPQTRGVLIINLGDPVELIGAGGDILRVLAGEGFVGGLYTAPSLSRTGGRQQGVEIGLDLLAMRAFLGADMAAFTDRVLPLRDVLGPSFAALGQRLGEARDDAARFDLLDQAVATRLLAAPDTDRAIAWAVARLRRAPATPVAALAARIGWGRQHFSERFRRETGLSPRSFARIARFERLVAALPATGKPDWAGLAAAHGFADQPHLAREVASLAGLTPTALAARMLPGGGFAEA